MNLALWTLAIVAGAILTLEGASITTNAALAETSTAPYRHTVWIESEEKIKCQHKPNMKGLCCNMSDTIEVCFDDNVYSGIIEAYKEKNTLFQGTPNSPPSSPDSTEITERLDRIIELLEKMRHGTYKGR